MISKTNRFLGAILLISGTTIGAGMLALPLTTGLAGFLPALCIMIAIWLYMLLTAYYLLEVNLRMPGESNLISMMGKTLGPGGQLVSWIIYLLLLYALMTAYMMGCTRILDGLLPLPFWVWPIVVFAIFAFFVYLGTSVVDFCNRVVMLGLVISYVCVLWLGLRHIQAPLLTHVDWGYLLPSVSVVLTTFGFHIIIPTLTTYLDHDTRLLKLAIFIGSLIPFIIYILWQLFVIGVIPPYGDVSLLAANKSGGQVTSLINQVLSSGAIKIASSIFAFCAIVTSLLGVSLSLHDFLSDGLKLKKGFWGKLLIVVLTFFPPLFFTLFYPDGFVKTLAFAGVLVVILLALLPAAMTWYERYGQQSKRSFIVSKFRVFGGKPLIILTCVIALLLVALEIFL